MTTATAEQSQNSRVPKNFQPHVFQKGVSGNPSGKPKGTVSLKKFAQKYIQGLSEDEKIEFMEGIPKIEIWRMSEGMPSSHTDITTNGESLQPVLVKFIDGAKSNGDTSGI